VGPRLRGLPTDSNGDMAWVQHMVEVDGAAHRAAWRSCCRRARSSAAASRADPQHLLEKDLVEAVIGLAPNLFYGTGLAACVLVLRRASPSAKGKVLIVDASSLFRAGARRTSWSPEHGAQILGWVHGFADVEDRARVVSARRDREGGLDAQHLALRAAADRRRHPAAAEAVAAFKDALAKCREAEDNLRKVMVEGAGCHERAHDPTANSSPTSGAPPSSCAASSTPATTSSSSSRCCSTSASRTCGTRTTPRARRVERRRRLRRPRPPTTASSSRRCALEGRARAAKDVGKALQRRRCAPSRPPTPTARRHLRRRPVDQQGAPARRHAQEPARALLGHTLSLANVPEDELGNGYEFLIKKFADDSGHTAQEFYTNRTVVHLMVQMLEPKPGESIYDPTCGTGRHADLGAGRGEAKGRRAPHAQAVRAGAQPHDRVHRAHEPGAARRGGFEIARGDTLARRLRRGRPLKTFDVVLANPPYSIKQWNREAWRPTRGAATSWARRRRGAPTTPSSSTS
jgi:type I restriction-modification system DNA methylase subunit